MRSWRGKRRWSLGWRPLGCWIVVLKVALAEVGGSGWWREGKEKRVAPVLDVSNGMKMSSVDWRSHTRSLILADNRQVSA